VAVRRTIGCGQRIVARLCDIDNSTVVATACEAMREVGRWCFEVVMAIYLVYRMFGGGRKMGRCHVITLRVRIKWKARADSETRRRHGGQNSGYVYRENAKSKDMSSECIVVRLANLLRALIHIVVQRIQM
jgi:hypothetical protein